MLRLTELGGFSVLKFFGLTTMPTTSPWIRLARLNVPVTVAAAAMRCSKATAAKRLEEAEAALGQIATPAQEKAVAVLTASGAAKPDISRRRWHQFVDGSRPAWES